jgi:hypothetical protein
VTKFSDSKAQEGLRDLVTRDRSGWRIVTRSENSYTKFEVWREIYFMVCIDRVLD